MDTPDLDPAALGADPGGVPDDAVTEPGEPYWDALIREHEEAEQARIDRARVDPGVWETDAGPSADAVIHDSIGVLDRLDVQARMLVAEQYLVTAEILHTAATDQDVWVGPDPTRDPDWVDPRGKSVAALRRDRADLAVRAAVADIATRLRVSENTVRARVATAEILRARTPRVWAAFAAGATSEQHARATAAAAATLPDDPDVWARFDELLVGPATRTTPSVFRARVRVVRERVHPESAEVRHARAADTRGVWLDDGDDAMATLTALLPAVDAHRIMSRLDATARHLRDQPDESRTLVQLRADTLTDLVTTRNGDTADAGSGGSAVPAGPAVSAGPGMPAVPATIVVTVPALTLLGASDEPAILEGHGPIDLDTARHLAGDAPTWTRILTDPVTGTVITADPRTYRVPTAMRRWLHARDPHCAFPGCRRRSRECDIDHVTAWHHGGPTTASNLHPLCRHHHRLKHDTRWHIASDAGADHGSRPPSWTSPTGQHVDHDPPPF